MSDLNALFLQGRLTKDASLNTLSNGSAVATLSLAVNKDYFDRTSNNWKRITNFFDVIYWGESAKKNLAEYSKGREVLVEAELKTSSWEKDGKKFSRVEIRANKVRALRRPGEGKELQQTECSLPLSLTQVHRHLHRILTAMTWQIRKPPKGSSVLNK